MALSAPSSLQSLSLDFRKSSDEGRSFEILHSLPSPIVEKVILMQKEVEMTSLATLVLIACGRAENTFMPEPDLPSGSRGACPRCAAPRCVISGGSLPQTGLVLFQCLGRFRDSLLIANIFSSWMV